MAMDKNDQVNLFRKVPDVKKLLVEPLEQLAFLDVQIFERKKALTRDFVDIEKLRVWANSDDPNCVQAAENGVPELSAHMKGLKQELSALEKVRATLVGEVGDEQVDGFYQQQMEAGQTVPAEWLKKRQSKIMKEPDLA